MCTFCSAHAKPNFLVTTMMAYLLRPSSVSWQQAWKSPLTGLFAFDCCFWGHKGCLLIGGIPRFHGLLEPACQTWTLFSFLLSTVTLEQVHEKYTSTIQKLPMWFFRFWNSPGEKKLHGPKCGSLVIGTFVFSPNRGSSTGTRYCADRIPWSR